MGGTTSGSAIKTKGLSRTWELCMDNLVRFLVSNLLCLVSLIPGAFGTFIGVMDGGQPIWLLLSGIVGGALFGTCYGAMMDGILIAMRDSSGGWWKRYRHAWKRDWRDNLLPGALMGTLVALVLHVLCRLGSGQSLPPAMLASTVAAAVVAVAIFTYLWPQRVFLDLGIAAIFYNCLLMILRHPLKTLLAVLAQGLYWGMMLFLFPYSTILLLILGLWFPALVSTQILYQQLNCDLKIEERLGIVPDSPDEEEE